MALRQSEGREPTTVTFYKKIISKAQPTFFCNDTASLYDNDADDSSDSPITASGRHPRTALPCQPQDGLESPLTTWSELVN